MLGVAHVVDALGEVGRDMRAVQPGLLLRILDGALYDVDVGPPLSMEPDLMAST